MGTLIVNPYLNGFLADQYAKPLAAYSLRKLAHFNINILRVRRSSDNTEQDFTANDINNGALTSWVGVGDGFVKTWYDQSGNGNHAQQSDVGKQPLIVSSGTIQLVNNKPSIQFPQNKFLSLSSLQLSFPFSAFWLIRTNATNLSAFIRFGGHNPHGQFRYGADSLGGWFNGALTGSTLSGQQQHLNTYISSGSTSISLATNGSVAVENTGTYEISDSDFFIGSHTGTLYFLDGQIQEVILYPVDVSAYRAGIESNINNYYNIF